ncbi:MAG: hypothetical protein A2Y81_12000 [Nitrospirae bacterium RBG_13_43_8]|nr:MAG: hypothetical protein A2Y81_12000 [Nitrospirae bacterium RBG_13_43_8]
MIMPKVKLSTLVYKQDETVEGVLRIYTKRHPLIYTLPRILLANISGTHEQIEIHKDSISTIDQMYRVQYKLSEHKAHSKTLTDIFNKFQCLWTEMYFSLHKPKNIQEMLNSFCIIENIRDYLEASAEFLLDLGMYKPLVSSDASEGRKVRAYQGSGNDPSWENGIRRNEG